MRRSKITGLLLIMGMFLAGCGANSGSAGIEEDAVMRSCMIEVRLQEDTQIQFFRSI